MANQLLVELNRTDWGPYATIGDMTLITADDAGRYVVREHLCHTLEDTPGAFKVPGVTCIPAGAYRLALRIADTPFNTRYKKRFGDFHHGMIWLQDVPGYEWVYIHIGNYPKDTAGCILVGKTKHDGYIGQSEDAYRAVYPCIANAIVAGWRVQMIVRDISVRDNVGAAG